MDTSDFLLPLIWFVKQVLMVNGADCRSYPTFLLMLIYSSRCGWCCVAGLLCGRSFCSDDAAMWTMFLVMVGVGWVLPHRCLCRFCCGFYVEVMVWFTIVLLSGHVKGGHLMGFVFLLALKLVALPWLIDADLMETS
ncbi:hypothetical protein Nepgr_006637 [Nepenthes gracilis]|uniref:Transmembrane protein n=1 Tax=Nepenthes gracilis TaxID=150966 RepID=A0AAD3XHI3_NEPGR|nr:hypothetical protein Nepgr_006637 [Nepenthes gracilis]